MTTPRPRPILIVDDDPDAVALTKHALAKAGIKTQIDVMENGDHAISYLKDRLAQGDHALPLLLFLDLKMPGMGGFEVLAWIKQQPALKEIPVAILTSSPEASDSAKAERLGAQKFLVKPPTPEVLQKLFSEYLLPRR